MPSRPSIAYLEDLSPSETEQLTSLLNKNPQCPTSDEGWLTHQAKVIGNFPKALLREKGLLPRLTMSLPFTPKGAFLCTTHKPLNPYLIRRIFLQVSAEVTMRVRKIAERVELPQEVLLCIRRLQSVNSLWMSSVFYTASFPCIPAEQRFEKVPGGCEACILSSVGGNFQILADLRTSLVSRRKKGCADPRLLKLVDVWINWTTCCEAIVNDSDELGKEMRAIRREMQQEKRERKAEERAAHLSSSSRRSSSRSSSRDSTSRRRSWSSSTREGRHSRPPSSVPSVKIVDIDDVEGKVADPKQEFDFENSIVDFYADMMSKAELPKNADLNESLHPAFQGGEGTRRAGAGGNNPTRPPPVIPAQYSESVYSRDENGMSYNGSTATGRDRTAQERARALRDLTGGEVGGSSPVSRRGQPPKPSRGDDARRRPPSVDGSQMTELGDFY